MWDGDIPFNGGRSVLRRKIGSRCPALSTCPVVLRTYSNIPMMRKLFAVPRLNTAVPNTRAVALEKKKTEQTKTVPKLESTSSPRISPSLLRPRPPPAPKRSPHADGPQTKTRRPMQTPRRPASAVQTLGPRSTTAPVSSTCPKTVRPGVVETRTYNEPVFSTCCGVEGSGGTPFRQDERQGCSFFFFR